MPARFRHHNAAGWFGGVFNLPAKRLQPPLFCRHFAAKELIGCEARIVNAIVRSFRLYFRQLLRPPVLNCASTLVGSHSYSSGSQVRAEGRYPELSEARLRQLYELAGLRCSRTACNRR